MAAYTSFAAFLFFAIALIVPSGFSVGPVLLVLAGCIFARQYLHNLRKDLRKQDYRMIAVPISYFLLCSAVNMMQGTPVREYDGPLRFLLAIPALLLLLTHPPRAAAIWSGLALGGIGAGLLATWQHFALGHERVGGFTNPIQFGNISLLLGVLCLAGLGWARTQARAQPWKMLLGAGMVLGVLGSLYSGSRGSWLALPFCLIVLCFCATTAVRQRYLTAGAIAVTLGIATAYAVPRAVLADRIELAVSETNGYLDQHNAATSIGARLEMWRTAWMLIGERPLLGWSKQGYMDQVQQWIREGKVHAVVGMHSHLHNEYLDAWVKRGIPGLVSVLILFFMPLVLFGRQWRQGKLRGDLQTQGYALAGMMLCPSYIAFGFTQAFLTHINGIMLYAFTLVILWAAASRPLVHSQHPEGSA